MKTKRMLNGIPTLFFYDKSNKHFPPTYSISTGKESVIEDFLKVVAGAI
jgi:hypothetical protein